MFDILHEPKRVFIFLFLAVMLPACNMFVSDDERLQEAQTNYEQNRFNKVVVLTKKVLQSDPQNAGARMLLGKVQFARFRFKDALDSFTKARQAGLKSEELLSFWVRTLVAANDMKEALALFDDKDFAEAAKTPASVLLKGQLYFLQRDVANAQQSFNAHYSSTADKATYCLSQVKLLSLSPQPDKTAAKSIECENTYKDAQGFDWRENRYLRALSYLAQKDNDKAYQTLLALDGNEHDKKDVVLWVQSSLLLLKMYLVKGEAIKAANLSDQLQKYLVHPDIMYAKASLAAKDGDVALAEQLHLSALKLNANYKPSLLELVKLKYSQGNIEQAKFYANRADQASGGETYSQRLDEMLTVQLFQKGDFDSVIENITAMQENSGLKTNYLLALAYAKKGEEAKTWETFNRLVPQLENKEQQDLLKAKLNAELGKLAEAEKLYKSYVDKNSLSAMIGLAEVYMLGRKQDEAEQVLLKALAASKDDTKVIALLVRLYIARKQNDKAFALMNDIITRSGKNQHRNILAGLYYQTSRFNDAIKIAEQVLTQDKSDFTAKLISANSYMQLHDYDRARSGFLDILATKPDFMRGYLLLARIEKEKSDFKAAHKHLDDALKVRANYVAAISQKIELYVSANQNDQALEYAKTATSAITDQKTAHVVMGMTYSRLEQKQLAYREFNKALQGDLTDVGLAMRVYVLGKEVHGYPQASQEFLAWLTKANEERFYLQAAAEAMKIQDYEIAGALYEQSLTKGKATAVVYNNLAWIYSTTAKHDKAIDAAKKALQLAPDSVAIMDTVGWVMVNADRLGDAEIYLSKAYAKLGKNPTVAYHMATLYYKQNKKDQAKSILNSIKDAKFPEKEQANELLQKL